MRKTSFLAIALFSFLLPKSIEGNAILTHINGWYKAACIPEVIKENDNYICTHDGKILCLPGYQDEKTYCTTPHCDPPCVRGQGNCSRPFTCECEVGWKGADCSQCVCLPGCVNGGCVDKPFECVCEPGWGGMFCDKPICSPGCLHGHCTVPGQCICHPGWTGPNCDQCTTLPDCENGYCERPMQCLCHTGYYGSYCQFANCSAGCHPEYGFCTEPNECWCRPGWTGPNCDTCVKYPGCQNGYCKAPYDCKCLPGWVGKLCDRRDFGRSASDHNNTGGGLIIPTTNFNNSDFNIVDDYDGINGSDTRALPDEPTKTTTTTIPLLTTTSTVSPRSSDLIPPNFPSDIMEEMKRLRELEKQLNEARLNQTNL